MYHSSHVMFQALLHIQKLRFKIKEDVNMIENSIENIWRQQQYLFHVIFSQSISKPLKCFQVKHIWKSVAIYENIFL